MTAPLRRKMRRQRLFEIIRKDWVRFAKLLSRVVLYSPCNCTSQRLRGFGLCPDPHLPACGGTALVAHNDPTLRPNKRFLIAQTWRDELLAGGAHLNEIYLRLCNPTCRRQNGGARITPCDLVRQCFHLVRKAAAQPVACRQAVTSGISLRPGLASGRPRAGAGARIFTIGRLLARRGHAMRLCSVGWSSSSRNSASSTCATVWRKRLPRLTRRCSARS